MKKKIWIGILGILFGTILLYVAMRNVNLSKTIAILLNTNPIFLFPYPICVALFYWLKAIRMKMLLAGIKEIKSIDLFGPIIIGFAFNNILPLRLGEVIRMYVTSKQIKISQITVLSSIGLERIFDIIGLCLFTLVLPLLKDVRVRKLGPEFLIISSCGILLFFIGFSLVRMRYRSKLLLIRSLFFLPENYIPTVEAKFDRIIDGLLSLNDFRIIKFAILNTLIQWVLLIACIFLSAMSVSVQLSLSAVVLVLLTCTIGVALPGAPAFVGTIELAFVIVLGWYGISVDKAFAVAIIYHSLNFFIVTSTGILIASRMGIRIKSLVAYISSNTNDPNSDR